MKEVKGRRIFLTESLRLESTELLVIAKSFEVISGKKVEVAETKAVTSERRPGVYRKKRRRRSEARSGVRHRQELEEDAHVSNLGQEEAREMTPRRQNSLDLFSITSASSRSLTLGNHDDFALTGSTLNPVL